MLVGDRLVPRVYAQARAPAHSGLNPVIMVYFHSTFDLAQRGAIVMAGIVLPLRPRSANIVPI